MEPLETSYGAETAPRSSPLPVLIWSGFFLTNIAVIVLIVSAVYSMWILAMGLTILYSIVLFTLGRRLEKLVSAPDTKYPRVNDRSTLDLPIFLIWMMFCFSVFVNGLYVPVQVISRDDPGEAFRSRRNLPVIVQELPEGASRDLKLWAYSGYMFTKSTIQVVDKVLYFSEPSALYSLNDKQVVKITPDSFSAVESLVVYKNRLYFTAESAEEQKLHRDVFYVENATIHVFTSGRDLFVENDFLWIKFHDDNYNSHMKRSDGTVEGTIDLSDPDSDPGENRIVRQPLRHWKRAHISALFLAHAPYLGTSGFLLYRKKLPSLWLNVYSGGIFLLVSIVEIAQFNANLFWKITLSLVSVGVYVVTAWFVVSREKFTRHTDWILSGNAVVFFYTACWICEVPYSGNVGQWFGFFVLSTCLVGLGIVSLTNVSVYMGGLGWIFVTFRISSKIGGGVNIGSFIPMVLIGVGIIYGAVEYNKNKENIARVLKEKFGIPGHEFNN